MYKVIGENILTFNAWDCVTGIETFEEAMEIRKGWVRMETDYKIEYAVEREA